MEAEPTDACKMRDDELNEALEGQAVEELDGLSIKYQRMARIQEYEEEAVSRFDPFAAVIGMGNAGLQRIFECMGAAILAEMESQPHSVKELREIAPHIRLLVKLRDAIETELAFRPDDGRQATAFPPMKDKGPVTKMAKSIGGLVPKRWMGNA